MVESQGAVTPPGSGGAQARQDAHRVVAVDRLQFASVEICRETLHVLGSRAIRVIRAEHDLRNRNQFRQRADGDRVGNLRGVVIEAPELAIDGLAGSVTSRAVCNVSRSLNLLIMLSA